MVHKLFITGHVHGRPDEKITESRSWPTGRPLSVALELITNFDKAFTLEKAEITSEPRRA